MKVLVTGAGGQLGEAVTKQLARAHDVRGFSHGELDITDPAQTKSVLRDVNPDAVVNAAAYTDVDAAENEPEAAFRTNALGVKYLREAAGKIEARLIHVSTDYVFDGRKNTPYTTEDCPRPLNTYGASKVAGEHFVFQYARGLVIRTSGLYGGKPGCHNNFVNTVINFAKNRRRLTIVEDQVTSPTWVKCVARIIACAIEDNRRGVIHYSSGTECSWYEFARFIMDRRSLDVEVIPTSSDQLDQSADRPPYSYLKNSVDRFQYTWKQMLEEYFSEHL